jgi:hypothetical protein
VPLSFDGVFVSSKQINWSLFVVLVRDIDKYDFCHSQPFHSSSSYFLLLRRILELWFLLWIVLFSSHLFLVVLTPASGKKTYSCHLSFDCYKISMDRSISLCTYSRQPCDTCLSYVTIFHLHERVLKLKSFSCGKSVLNFKSCWNLSEHTHYRS